MADQGKEFLHPVPKNGNSWIRGFSGFWLLPMYITAPSSSIMRYTPGKVVRLLRNDPASNPTLASPCSGLIDRELLLSGKRPLAGWLSGYSFVRQSGKLCRSADRISSISAVNRPVCVLYRLQWYEINQACT